MTKTKTATPEDQAPAVDATAAAAVAAPEAPPIDPGADEAAAAAEAEAAAKAEAAAPAEPIDPKRIEDLNHLARTIHMLNTTGHRLGLVDELANLWGAEIVEGDDPYAVTVAMQGITTDPADSIETALTNWANAARRTIAAAAA